MARILLVDDDRELTNMLAEYLQGEGFEIVPEYNGDQGLARMRDERFDAVVLDVMLPGRDGLAVLREFRRHDATPVLMLTARGDDVDTVVGLELGADDYLPKPCNPRVLVARLRALLRRGERSPPASAPRELKSGGVVLHLGRREVLVDGMPVELTAAEFELLSCLLAHAGQVVSKERLSREALNRPLLPFDRSIDMHMSNLRRKLGPLPGDVPRIKTVRGVGYQYVND